MSISIISIVLFLFIIIIICKSGLWVPKASPFGNLQAASELYTYSLSLSIYIYIYMYIYIYIHDSDYTCIYLYKYTHVYIASTIYKPSKRASFGQCACRSGLPEKHPRRRLQRRLNLALRGGGLRALRV